MAGRDRVGGGHVLELPFRISTMSGKSFFFCTNELFIISAGICIEAIQDGG